MEKQRDTKKERAFYVAFLKKQMGLIGLLLNKKTVVNL